MIFRSEKIEQSEASQDSGFTLVVVLFFLILVAAITTPFVLAARSHLLITHNSIAEEIERAQLLNLLEIAAAVHTMGVEAGVDWQSETVNCVLQLSNGKRASVGYINHAGLIDLNAASEDLLALGFAALEFSALEAKDYAQQVVEFRTIRASGFDTPVRLENAPRGGNKQRPFEHIAEIYDLPGLDRFAYRQISQIFTVHSRSGTVDVLRMPTDLLDVARNVSDTNTPFLISSGIRHPAFSIDVTLADQEGRALSASRVFFADASSGRHVALGATHYDYSQSNALNESNNDICNVYFPSTTVAIMEEIAA